VPLAVLTIGVSSFGGGAAVAPTPELQSIAAAPNNTTVIFIDYGDHVNVYSENAASGAGPIRSFTLKTTTGYPIAVDYSGKVYIAGSTVSWTNSTPPSFTIWEYGTTARGNAQPIATYTIPDPLPPPLVLPPQGINSDAIQGMAIRPDGSIALAITRNTYHYLGPGASSQYFGIIEAPSTGSLAIVDNFFNGPNGSIALGAAVDGSGAVLVCSFGGGYPWPTNIHAWEPQSSGFQAEVKSQVKPVINGAFYTDDYVAASSNDELAVGYTYFKTDVNPLPGPIALTPSVPDNASNSSQIYHFPAFDAANNLYVADSQIARNGTSVLSSDIDIYRAKPTATTRPTTIRLPLQRVYGIAVTPL
jgi:hypothetical protein